MNKMLSGITQQHLFSNEDEKNEQDKKLGLHKIDYIFKFLIHLHVYFKILIKWCKPNI